MPTTEPTLIHSPLHHWARTRPEAIALSSETCHLSFAGLHALVARRAEALGDAPATVLLYGPGWDTGQDAGQDVALPPGAVVGGVVDTLVNLLAIISTGRCAAVGDASWPAHVTASVAAAMHALAGSDRAAAAEVEADLAPFYIGFTSGSTGQPKGFRRHHRSWVESFRVTLKEFGSDAAGCIVAPGRMTHSLFLFGTMLGLWTGAGAVVQERFSAAQTMASLIATPDCVLVAVPSQLLLLLQLAQRRRLPPVPQVRCIFISGARWMREHTPKLRQLFPNARVVEFYGASEASYIAWMDASPEAPPQAVGRPFSNVQLRIGPSPDKPCPPGQPGRIWVRSPMLFMDYVHAADDSAACYHPADDGAGNWLTVRDMGWLDESGTLHLCGRENRMIVTRGKNLFPEELEARLQAHPAIARASVLGVPDALRGMRIHAVVQGHANATATPPPAAVHPTPHQAEEKAQNATADQPTARAQAGYTASVLTTTSAAAAALPSPDALAAWCRTALEDWKTPRHYWLWHGPWPQTSSGKTDHATIRATIQAAATDAAAASHNRHTAPYQRTRKT